MTGCRAVTEAAGRDGNANMRLEQCLEKILGFEEAGYIGEALGFLERVLELFPEKKSEILFEKAKMEFRNRLDKKALLDFIAVYRMTGDDTLYELILEAYYSENKKELNGNYDKNIKKLEKYPHYRAEKKKRDIELIPIWQDSEVVVCADKIRKEFVIHTRDLKEVSVEKDKAAMLVNELWIEEIRKLEENYHIGLQFLDEDIPLYLVFDKEHWEVFLQLYDIKELLEKNRMVFLVGEEYLYEYFKEDMVIYPEMVCYNGFQEIYWPILVRVFEEAEKEMQENKNEIEEYYEKNADTLIQHIKEGKPRILFFTSYFTTALKFHTRDCMQASSKLGCEVQLLMEPDGIHRVYYRDIFRTIKRFKPDIMFNIDHFRYEYKMFPKEIVWVTWIQDPLPHILDDKTPSKLSENDFVMNIYTGMEGKKVWQTFPRQMFAPLVANNDIYKPYNMDKVEIEKYGADLCMVCHAADAEKGAEELLGLLEGEDRLIVKDMLRDYYNLVDAGGQIFYTQEGMADFIDKYAKQFYATKLSDSFIAFLAEKMCLDLAQRMYRQIVADWLIETGYYKIKLWGNGWLESPKYQGYAMGVAQNGVILSKIYQSTKIVLGSNFFATGMARVWESMLSGAFYLGNYIPPEVDAIDVRKVLREEDNLVMYYNKQDLLDKVEYYLSYEEERRKMAERGRQAALKGMTYTALMQNMLDFLKKSLDA
jgi:hypothetical protein